MNVAAIREAKELGLRLRQFDSGSTRRYECFVHVESLRISLCSFCQLILQRSCLVSIPIGGLLSPSFSIYISDF